MKKILFACAIFCLLMSCDDTYYDLSDGAENFTLYDKGDKLSLIIEQDTLEMEVDVYQNEYEVPMPKSFYEYIYLEAHLSDRNVADEIFSIDVRNNFNSNYTEEAEVSYNFLLSNINDSLPDFSFLGIVEGQNLYQIENEGKLLLSENVLDFSQGKFTFKQLYNRNRDVQESLLFSFANRLEQLKYRELDTMYFINH
ncbi:hypothetical protein [Marivirga atlantica]|jgi:hypothetical protein|uniref:Uncharacterized protein n=1 Tax=Marivirga atlantica TaxID=1548457 RepID=A0A937A995_9BACT|nr:hypothetical protein [Marivirga atlantica]MBL0764681.1 hypothetical protein [Marivirga atlantica]